MGRTEPLILVGCRIEFVSAQAARGVRVLPLDRTGAGRVGVDVATKFTGQIGDRCEDAAGDDLALDFGEPEFDLVEPGRIGRREVKLHARMALEKIGNGLGFMRGEVVEDDVNLLPGPAQRHHFFQKSHEIAAGVAGRGFSVHPAGLGVQRGIQRKRAMTVVLKPVTLGSSRRERQNRIEPVQR